MHGFRRSSAPPSRMTPSVSSHSRPEGVNPCVFVMQSFSTEGSESIRSRHAVILGAKRRESMRSRHAVILGAKRREFTRSRHAVILGAKRSESTCSRHAVILDRRE